MQSGVYYANKSKVSILTIANKPLNVLSLNIRQGLNLGIDQALKDQSKSIIITSKGQQFSSGIDIVEYTRQKHLIAPNLNEIIKKIDNSKIPIIAGIHGGAIGSGLELALACHWRLATSNSKFGLPQVNLGLMPSNGGTQRLPRLIGIKDAIDIMISGRNITSKDALRLGLIDSIFDEDVNCIDKSIDIDKLIEFSLSDKVLNSDLNSRRISLIDTATLIKDPSIELSNLRKTIEKSSRGYVAPLKIMDAVSKAIECNNFDDGIIAETSLFEELDKHSQSRALKYFSFNEQRMASNKNNDKKLTKTINSVGIVGGGTMGRGIAMSTADANIKTVIVEKTENEILATMKNIEGTYKKSSAYKTGKVTDEDIAKKLSLISPATNLNQLKDVDLVIEAVYENIDTKKKIFADLDKILNKDTIMATNTSALDIDDIASSTSSPIRVIGTHFFSPANIMKLLEVIKGKETSTEVIDSCMNLAKRIGKIPVLAGNCYGFIGNRMLDPYCREAHYCVEEGATPLQIDTVLKRDVGLAMGVFEMLDLAGNDIGYRQRKDFIDKGIDNGLHSKLADKLCDAGFYGQKTGKGWYLYDPKNPRVPLCHNATETLIEKHRNEVNITSRNISDAEIIERTLYSLVNEGMKILEEGIAEKPEDIDVIYVYGYGFPKYRGGPMWWAEREVGLVKVLTSIKEYHEKYPDKKWWKPSKLLEDIVASGSTIREELYFRKKG